MELNRVAEIYDGTHQTPHYTDFGVRFVSVENIDSLYESPKYISFTDFEKYKVRPQKDDVLMTRIGSIGLCAVVERNEPLAYYVSLALIRPNTSVILSKYLLHVIHSRIGQRELAKRTLTTAAPIKINMGDIGKIVIPIPPIAIQERIISILDSFDLICNSKTCGLPAAINARRLQYIYYREKLLTFKRKTVA